MVGYSFASADNSLMPMLERRPSTSSRRFKEVETVRIFTASGHPWMALAALAMWRFRWPSAVFAAIVYAKHGMF